MDRPHIIYNKKTKKFVCWLKIINQDGTQSETVLAADDILGPYTIVREGLRPLNMSAGDFDLPVAPDGKAYYYFERVHSETICADLTEDYTDVTGYYSTHFPHSHPPHVREATAHFTRKGKHYPITSGTTRAFMGCYMYIARIENSFGGVNTMAGIEGSDNAMKEKVPTETYPGSKILVEHPQTDTLIRKCYPVEYRMHDGRGN